MKKQLIIKWGCSLFFILLVFFLGITIGKATGQRQEVSFYAQVEEVKGTLVHVHGIPENDVNHRGQFILSLDGRQKTKLLDYAGNPLDPQALTEAALIEIFYDGMVMETEPAQIGSVYKIQVIE